MAPTIPLAPQSTYRPTNDAVARVTKRKPASTGGGRAWSEEEELYLLQTRLQKMPYKHIAAHLKKTELACRLHYHQLSHGNSRRKRTTSVSSGSSTGHRSPVMPLTARTPIREVPASRSVSPPGSAGSYGPHSPHASGLGGGGGGGGGGVGIQLPSIMGGNGHGSPRLPAILPKPSVITLPPLITSPSRGGYPTPLPEPHSAALPSALPSGTFPPFGGAQQQHQQHPTTPPLRLDCSVLPPPSASARHAQVDMGRLHAVYAAHRASFWSAVAADYGAGANPHALEQAWRTSGGCCGGGGGGRGGGGIHHYLGSAAPLTPAGSPDNSDRECGKDRTRISAILGMETHPRSPQDQQMVRRMDEERHVVAASA